MRGLPSLATHMTSSPFCAATFLASMLIFDPSRLMLATRLIDQGMPCTLVSLPMPAISQSSLTQRHQFRSFSPKDSVRTRLGSSAMEAIISSSSPLRATLAARCIPLGESCGSTIIGSSAKASTGHSLRGAGAVSALADTQSCASRTPATTENPLNLSPVK